MDCSQFTSKSEYKSKEFRCWPPASLYILVFACIRQFICTFVPMFAHSLCLFFSIWYVNRQCVKTLNKTHWSLGFLNLQYVFLATKLIIVCDLIHKLWSKNAQIIIMHQYIGTNYQFYYHKSHVMKLSCIKVLKQYKSCHLMQYFFVNSMWQLMKK